MTKKERYLLTVQGRETDRPPIWLMRQAGRYMPEYQALRSGLSFHDLCYKPEISAKATLLPLEILDIDILIIFNDILVPLESMGLEVTFPTGGPEITNPVRTESDLEHFKPVTFATPPVAQSLQQTRRQAGDDVPVLGFCGAPFTLAAYAVEGKLSRNHHQIKELRFAHPELLHEILRRLAETAAAYLVSQIEEGGAHGVQVFESWGGILANPHDYEEFAARYQRAVIHRVKEACPDTPVHLFVRGSAPVLGSMASTGADVLSVDWQTSLAEARRQTALTLQGNLDPTALHIPEAVPGAVQEMLQGFDWRRGWIANLGHGILPQASVEGAKSFVGTIRALADGTG